MTEAKHTPGPWALWTGCSWRRFGSETTGTEVVVPTNHPIDGHPDLLFPNGGQDGPDARLIAAAPELLDELKASASGCEQIANSINSQFPEAAAYLRTRALSAHAAIAKAER